MNIDKDKVREAIETPNSMITFYGIEILKEVSKEYLAGKIVEPMPMEMVRQIIIIGIEENTHYHNGEQRFTPKSLVKCVEAIATALLDKVSKQFEPASKEEIEKIIPVQQWLYDKGFGDIIVNAHRGNNVYVSEAIKGYVEALVGKVGSR